MQCDMNAIVEYQRADYSLTNDAFLGKVKGQTVISIDDGGKQLGEFIVALLAGDATIKAITAISNEELQRRAALSKPASPSHDVEEEIPF